MPKGPEDFERQLRSLLDSHELTKAVTIRLRGTQIYLGREELPGPFSQGEVEESIRLTSLGNDSFGLSVKRHTRRWERTPYSGTLADLVQVIHTNMQHLIAPW